MLIELGGHIDYRSYRLSAKTWMPFDILRLRHCISKCDAVDIARPADVGIQSVREPELRCDLDRSSGCQ